MRKIAILSLILFFALSISRAATPSGDHFNQGLALFEQGMWGAAREEFSKSRATAAGKESLVIRSEAMMALCSGAEGLPDAQRQLEEFLLHHPHTTYHDAIQFALADQFYRRGEWSEALERFTRVNMRRLRSSQRDEYCFKTGYSYFRTDDPDSAYEMLGHVEVGSSYSPSAIYYRAYIDYIAERFAPAKEGFRRLEADASYGQLVPFYLLQIEFLEKNYTYVTSHGAELLRIATPSRAREIARAMAESWYHLQGHAQTLDALARYRTQEGVMGRQEYYIEGYSYYMLEQYQNAATALAAACGPDDALSQNASYHLADCYLKLGELPRAMQSFSIAATSHYDEQIAQDALFNYGKLQYDLGGGVFNEAINLLTRYIATYPRSEQVNQAREYLLAAYYNSRNYDAAWEAIDQIADPDNNIRAAKQKITYFRALEQLTTGRLEEAERMLVVSSQNQYNAKYSALANFWRGEIAFLQGNYQAAIPLYREYIRLSPRAEIEHAAAWYALGYSHFNLRRWSSAREALTGFLALTSSALLPSVYRADAYNRLGDVFHAERSYWNAIEQYDNAVRIGGGEQYYAAWQRALMLGLLSRTDGKIEALQQIIALGEGDYVDDALLELGRTRMNQQLFAEANEFFMRYLRDFPDGERRVEVLADQALVAQNMGYSDRAIEYYKQTIAAAPGTAAAHDALLGLRSIYVEQNNVAEYFAYAARAGMESDVSELGRDSITFAAAQRLYLAGENPARAAEALKSYVEGYPRGAYRLQATFYLGDCALRAGDRQTAKAAYGRLIAPPQNAYTLRALEALCGLLEQDGQYAEAMNTYLRLSREAPQTPAVNRALEGYLRTAARVDSVDMRQVAAHVLSAPDIGGELERQARFALAEAHAAAGDTQEAFELYEQLSAEVSSQEGAQSAFRVIEYYAGTGQPDRAKEHIFALAAGDTPHEYWLGRAFLKLGDLYLAQGDAFQARATWQSIVDGYSIADDGVIDQAKAKISKL